MSNRNVFQYNKSTYAHAGAIVPVTHKHPNAEECQNLIFFNLCNSATTTKISKQKYTIVEKRQLYNIVYLEFLILILERCCIHAKVGEFCESWEFSHPRATQ
jgi:hypothetical protein